jgi:hypothetical protein
MYLEPCPVYLKDRLYEEGRHVDKGKYDEGYPTAKYAKEGFNQNLCCI